MDGRERAAAAAAAEVPNKYSLLNNSGIFSRFRLQRRLCATPFPDLLQKRKRKRRRDTSRRTCKRLDRRPRASERRRTSHNVRRASGLDLFIRGEKGQRRSPMGLSHFHLGRVFDQIPNSLPLSLPACLSFCLSVSVFLFRIAKTPVDE